MMIDRPDRALRFATPATHEEARQRILELQARIGEVQVQLSDRNRTDGPGGRRLTPERYHAWRRAACSALHLKHVELRFLRDWLRQQATPPKRTLARVVLALGRVEVGGSDAALGDLRQALEGARQELGL